MSTLQGKRIALVEGRMSGTLADLVHDGARHEPLAAYISETTSQMNTY